MTDYRFIFASNGEIPLNAVVIGKDSKSTLYAGRIFHKGKIIPGMVRPNVVKPFMSMTDTSIFESKYEVLCCTNTAWQNCKNDKIPRNAIPFEVTSSEKNNKYIGRISHNNIITLGIIADDMQCLHIKCSEEEFTYGEYEILVESSCKEQNHSFEPASPNHLTVPPNAVIAGIGQEQTKQECECATTYYVGRARNHIGDTFLGLVRNKPLGGVFSFEDACNNWAKEYEVFCSTDVAWQYGKGGGIPKKAIVMGQTIDGKKLYIGRALCGYPVAAGKITSSDRELSYKMKSGRFSGYKEYEILVDTTCDKQGYNFVPFALKGNIPSEAAIAGRDLDRSSLYVGRALRKGEIEPIKIKLDDEDAIVTSSGFGSTEWDYEVVCCSVAGWQYGRNGVIPTNAIEMGKTSDGEKIYIGRAFLNDSVTLGKIIPSHGVLYATCDGQESIFKEYEVLVFIDSRT